MSKKSVYRSTMIIYFRDKIERIRDGYESGALVFPRELVLNSDDNSLRVFRPNEIEQKDGLIKLKYNNYEKHQILMVKKNVVRMEMESDDDVGF